MGGIGKFGACGAQDRCELDERCALHAECAAAEGRKLARQMRWALEYIARTYGDS
jgi:hypothetical protein